MKKVFAVLLCLFLMGCPNDGGGSSKKDNTPYLQGKLIILQAYGNGGEGSPAGASHSFVELYNITDEELDLKGNSLYYADGTSVGSGETNTATADGAWQSIALSGKIPAKGSFLILGAKHTDLSATRFKMDDNYGDIKNEMSLSRRGFKVALIKGKTALTVQNPFDTDGAGTITTGYIDMVGAANEYEDRDLIFGFETAPARNSASQAVRRWDKYYVDTDDNALDFEPTRYTPAPDGMSDDELELRKPRNAAAGAWDPFPAVVDEYDGLPATIAGTASAHAGKLLILQIGAGAADDEANVTRSFVELYNAGTSDIDLSGISLQYAAGTKVADNAARDGKWKKIDLTGTVKAGHSFLILGSKISTLANPALDFSGDDYGDLFDADFLLSNRAVKVALMESADLLTVQNPFSMGQNAKAAGYIDMIGVINDSTDKILGREGTTSLISGLYRISKQVGVRRTSATDTNVNSADFRIVTYNSIKNNADEMANKRPKNAAYGAWDPFPVVVDPVIAGTPDSLAGKLLILQAYGSSDTAAGVSHSFVELYNNTNAPINLTGIGLYYADGTDAGSGNTNTATEDGAWQRLSLTGTIPAKGSFLILGPKQSATARYQIPENSGDINSATFTLSNRAFKAALIRNAKVLVAQNPFDMGSGAQAEGYIDMVGAANEYGSGGRDRIIGFETAPARNSASVAVRRASLTDTDDNSVDFDQLRYASSGSMSNALLAVRKPRTAIETASGWDPFAEPIITGGSPKLMILQANIRGNNNGLPNSPTGGGFARSIVELYNNTDDDINLNNYSLHISQVDDWKTRIPLSGTIPSYCSFLIVSNAADNAYSVNATPRAILPAADLEYDFIIGLNAAGNDVGNSWKIALMVNQPTLLAVADPFTDTSLSANYVDMLGVGNNSSGITGFEGARTSGSAPQPPRRTSLDDTDNNNADFAQADFRGRTGSNGIDNDQLYKFWPRNSASGEWNPITGLPKVDPQVQ